LNQAKVAKIFNHMTGCLPPLMNDIPDLDVIDHRNVMIHDWQQKNHILVASCTINGEDLAFQMQVAGIHMLHNAILAIECVNKLGISRQAAVDSLKSFIGTDRRFQIHMINERPVVSDYGHHPQEIKATLNAARNVWPDKKLHLIFQAHRYSRLRYHFEDFVDVLSQVDQVVLVPVYSAGETEDLKYNIPYLMERLEKFSPIYLCSLKKIQDYLEAQSENDVVILQGAGNIGYVLEKASQNAAL
jgi:UDP-N-acetylmuramate--alanine ligase